MKWSFFKRSLSLVGDVNLALPPASFFLVYVFLKCSEVAYVLIFEAAQYHHGALHLFSSLAKSSPVTGE